MPGYFDPVADAHTSGFELGRIQGEQYGREAGFKAGHQSGYDIGYKDGREAGYNAGWHAAVAAATKELDKQKEFTRLHFEEKKRFQALAQEGRDIVEQFRTALDIATEENKMLRMIAFSSNDWRSPV